jgi:WbqC-like protein family
MSIAIMQPYVFPYIGYFQMIAAVETFVFYDDVHFIKKGWINKNRILLNGQDYTFTIPCVKISQNKLINETEVVPRSPEVAKLLAQIASSYKKSPHFEEVFPVLQGVLQAEVRQISELAQLSVVEVCHYLGMPARFVQSSIFSPQTRGMEKADRLIQITKDAGHKHYINAPGGKELYTKPYFAAQGVELSFIQPQSSVQYTQGKSKNFVPWLSIIDVLMNCSIDQIQSMMRHYYLD